MPNPESPWAIITAFAEELSGLNRVREAVGQTAFVARLFVRTMFSIFDGYAYYLKRQAAARAKQAGVTFTPKETEKLTQVRTVKKGGTERTVPNIIPTGENLLFACKSFGRVYGAEPPLIHGALPAQFQTAADVRNRITHPKSVADFEVSSSELRAIGELMTWFQSLMTWVKDQELHLIEVIKAEVAQSTQQAREQIERMGRGKK